MNNDWTPLVATICLDEANGSATSSNHRPTHSTTPLAVEGVVSVRQLTYFYSRKKIIDNLNMHVKKQEIYSLLGASGCGKTTLLRLILGRLKPSEGCVTTFGRSPDDPDNRIKAAGVGFMPQELALNGQLTVKETLNYFGLLYLMPNDRRTYRMSELVELLDLNGLEKQLVQQLSGGQKRRVSLAVALIHNPPLMILDEPTVGLDTLLTEVIWKHLRELTEAGKTVIITTHYIEEARDSNKVAFMRNGKLLMEEEPKKLLRNYKSSTLEGVFRVLAKGRGDQCVEECRDHKTVPRGEQQKYEVRSDNQVQGFQAAVRRTGGILMKNGKRLWRQKLLMFSIVLFPAFTLNIFCSTTGDNPKHLPLALGNESRQNWTELFVQLLDKEAFDIKHYPTDQLANDSVKNADTYAAILFYDEPYHIRCFLDGSVALNSQSIKKDILKTKEIFDYQTFNRSHLRKGATIDFLFVYGSNTTRMSDFMAPGMMDFLIFYGTTAITAIAFLTERHDGSLERARIAGASIVEFIVGQVVWVFCLLIGQIVLTVWTGFWWFNMPMIGSYILLFILLLLQGICGMFFGLMVSAVCASEMQALLAALGLMMLTLNITGVMWPIGTMPNWLQWISLIFPQTLAMEALRSICMRGFGLFHSSVWLGFAVTVVWIVVFLLVAIYFDSVLLKTKQLCNDFRRNFVKHIRLDLRFFNLSNSPI